MINLDPLLVAEASPIIYFAIGRSGCRRASLVVVRRLLCGGCLPHTAFPDLPISQEVAACNAHRRLRLRDGDISRERKKSSHAFAVAQELLNAGRQAAMQLSVVCLQPRRRDIWVSGGMDCRNATCVCLFCRAN